LFEFLKKKFSGTVGKVSDKFSDEEGLPEDETVLVKTEKEPVKGEKGETTPGKESSSPATSESKSPSEDVSPLE